MSEARLAPRTATASSHVLGALLLEADALKPAELERVLSVQRQTGERLGQAAVRLGLVTEQAVAKALAKQLALPYMDHPLRPDPSSSGLVRAAFARQRRVVPVATDGRSLEVAMEDPLDLATIDDLQFQSGRRVRVAVATPTAIRQGLKIAYAGEVSALARELPDEGRLRPAPPPPPHHDRAPLVRLVDVLLQTAIEGGASDLHVEQAVDEVVVRQRVDGILRRVTELPVAARRSLLARVKVMAGMDISVTRRPQDGGFTFSVPGRTLSVRVSTLPVEGGEKAVLRFLDPRSAPADLGELGFSPGDLERVRRVLESRQGVLLATGPTGSGKTSTLFGALGELDRDRLNVVTLEDPIEYRVNGVSQVQVDPRAGLTFPSALRSVLRQDPDVVMVGEVRDAETAEIAMSAAITGHLVLSTLHTIDAPSAVTRLLQMGVQPYLIAGGLAGVIAQRLVRRRCTLCADEPEGCSACDRGYRGRTGIFQVLTINEGLREAISEHAGTVDIRKRAMAGGMRTLRDEARRKISEGMTDQAEVERALGDGAADVHACRRCGAIASDGIGCSNCGWPRARACRCGRTLSAHWRFCPDCLRRAPPTLS